MAEKIDPVTASACHGLADENGVILVFERPLVVEQPPGKQEREGKFKKELAPVATITVAWPLIMSLHALLANLLDQRETAIMNAAKPQPDAAKPN
jgi:hypothetical protein